MVYGIFRSCLDFVTVFFDFSGCVWILAGRARDSSHCFWDFPVVYGSFWMCKTLEAVMGFIIRCLRILKKGIRL